MAKDWLNSYGTPANGVIRRFQEGGAMAPQQAPAPAPEGGGGGGGDIEAMLSEYAQSRDPQLAVAIADMLVEMMAAEGGGGGQAPAGPEAGAPPAAPMARNGMKMRRGPQFKKRK